MKILDLADYIPDPEKRAAFAEVIRAAFRDAGGGLVEVRYEDKVVGYLEAPLPDLGTARG